MLIDLKNKRTIRLYKITIIIKELNTKGQKADMLCFFKIMPNQMQAAKDRTRQTKHKTYNRDRIANMVAKKKDKSVARSNKNIELLALFCFSTDQILYKVIPNGANAINNSIHTHALPLRLSLGKKT